MRTRTQKGYTYHKRGWWYLRYFDDVLVNGVVERKQICRKLDVAFAGEFRTRKSIQSFVDKVLQPINAGAVTPQSTQLVTEFVHSYYIPEYIERELRPSSQKQFKDTFRNHIAPRLGQCTLRSFRTVHAQKILDDIAAQGILGKSSLKHCKSALSGIFAQAKRLGVIDTVNPADDTKLHKGRGSPGATHAYDLGEIATMLARLPEPAHTIVQTAAFSGLRHSELRGLTVDAFDAEHRQLHVRQSVWNSHTTEPKTAASKASVPLIRQLALALEAHIGRMGRFAEPGKPLFQAGNGKPLNLANLVRRTVRPAIERCIECHKSAGDHEEAGHPFKSDPACRWHGWHAFRRGLATNLHELGVDDKSIQAILRHSDLRTTTNIYIRSREKTRNAAMDLLENSLTCTQLAPTATNLVN